MAAIQRRRGSAARNDAALVRGAGETHRGHVRSENQDVLIVEPRLGLYAVLDGMGGTSAGDVAAHLAARSIAACIRQKPRTRHRSAEELLHLAIRTASLEVFTAGVRKREHLGMGTTVVACLVVDPTRVVIGHVGDSRAYLLRDGRLAALTRDHTVVQAMIDAGELSLDAVGRHPERHALTRCVGNPVGAPTWRSTGSGPCRPRASKWRSRSTICSIGPPRQRRSPDSCAGCSAAERCDQWRTPQVAAAGHRAIASGRDFRGLHIGDPRAYQRANRVADHLPSHRHGREVRLRRAVGVRLVLDFSHQCA
jgi:serine/threonine protein phosphatase PrpC